MRIELSDVMAELAVIAACVARVDNVDYSDLLQKLVDNMDASEKAYFRELYPKLTFSKRRGRKCPL